MRYFLMRRYLGRCFVWLVVECVFALVCPRVFQPSLKAQTAAGETATIESRYIVDMPTAGVLSKGKWSVDVYAFGNSGVMADVSLSPLQNFNVGLSYAGAGFLGNGAIVLQGIPGFHIRWRPLDETMTLPALLLGFQTQGRGQPFATNNFFGRYETNSPGLFLAVSKNFTFLGSLALHGGVNYSFDAGTQSSPNIYVGLEKTIGSVVSLSAEYNTTLDNPADAASTMARRGLLNVALRVFTGKGFTFELQVRDLLRNLRSANGVYRTLRMEYVAAF
jgi:hypothetical protein